MIAEMKQVVRRYPEIGIVHFQDDVFFSTSNFPDGMQPILRALPLTALNDSLRAVVNEGASVRDVARPLLVLSIWAAASYAAALKLFRWLP